MISLSVSRIRWLSMHTLELSFVCPRGMNYFPGQKVLLGRDNYVREYSLVSAPGDEELTLCVRHVARGGLSSQLARAKVGDIYCVSQPRGYFSYQSQKRRAIFVATGTGVSPFVSFARAGARKYTLLHGVRGVDELYYRDLFIQTAAQYIPCLSGISEAHHKGSDFFHGRVTTYLETRIASGKYDFYLCGSGDMIRDATGVIDTVFPEARVFVESFFT